MSDIKSEKSSEFKQNKLKTWTMSLNLLPHQTFILPEELFKKINPEIEFQLEIINDDDLR